MVSYVTQATGSATYDVTERHCTPSGTLSPHIRSAREPMYQPTTGLYGGQRTKAGQYTPAARHGCLSRKESHSLEF